MFSQSLSLLKFDKITIKQSKLSNPVSMCAFQIPMDMDWDVMLLIGNQVKEIREMKYHVERFEEQHKVRYTVCWGSFGSEPCGSLLRMIRREPRLRLIRKRLRELGMVGCHPLHTAEYHEKRWLHDQLR